jgi:tRNA (guanine-N7-)-methyltransferase
MAPEDETRRNFYGRRKGKSLRPAQKRDLEHLKDLSPGAVTRDENPDRTQLNPASIFGGDTEIWLEIGFGGGEHLVHQARNNPNIGFIGCEPYINGVAMLLGKIRDARLDNLRLHPGDARDLLDVLPDASLSRVFLLYPDPWPKKRHHRRRFVTPEHLIPLSLKMKPGAILRIATDIDDYVRQALEEVPKCGLHWQAERASDWKEPWPDWITTRYEAKALREGRVPTYLTFQKT